MKCPQLQCHSANQLFAFNAGTSTACISGVGELSIAANNAATAAAIETACRTWWSKPRRCTSELAGTSWLTG